MKKPRATIVTLPITTKHVHVTITDNVIPSADMTEWLLQWGDLWNGYTARLVFRNYRARGVIGGWKKKRKSIEFEFLNKELALLFKLAWGGA